jgi:Holliday junction resolvase-like predicted endonuclease
MRQLRAECATPGRIPLEMGVSRLPATYGRSMHRLINRRQQGDLGEASAIEWLTRQGAVVSTPVGHSPDYDVIADFNGTLARVQVKTTTQRAVTPDGHKRYPVLIATNGGNQSWNRISKRFDPSRFDSLFTLTGDGRRWFIPAGEIEARNSIQLGGRKYSEFEIERSSPIDDVVYGPPEAPLESPPQGEYPRGQRTATVNRQAQPSQVRLLPPPSRLVDRPRYERRAGRSGQATIWAKRRVTIPLQPFLEAGLAIGDRVRAHSDEPGQVVLTRINLPDSLDLAGASERDA